MGRPGRPADRGHGIPVRDDRVGGPDLGADAIVTRSPVRVGDVYIAYESEHAECVPETPRPGRTPPARRDGGGADRRDFDGVGRGDAERRMEPAIRIRSGYALKRLGATRARTASCCATCRAGRSCAWRPTRRPCSSDSTASAAHRRSASQRLLGVAAGVVRALPAELADRGLLDGVGAAPLVPEPESPFARTFKPREKSVEWVGDYFPRAYHDWGRVFFSLPT